MDKEKFLKSGLLEKYVLGLTTEEETSIVEYYLDQFPECAQIADEMRGAIDDYALMHGIEPANQKQENLTINPRDSNDPFPTTSYISANKLLIMGLMAALISTTAVLFGKLKNTRSELSQLQKKHITYKQLCEQKNHSIAHSEKILTFLSHGHTHQVHLVGTQLAPHARAIVYWNEEQKQAYMSVVNLPECKKNKQYQIWADVHGEMISLGTIEKGKPNLQLIEYKEEAESLNVTLEPQGGSITPTVSLLYANASM